MKKAAADPVDRFKELAAVWPPPAAAPRDGALSAGALEGALGEGQSDQEQVQALVGQITANSRLTAAAVTPGVTAAVHEKDSNAEKAKAASEAAQEAGKEESASGSGGTLELGDPVMLEPGWRAGTAIVLLVVFALCGGAVAALGDASNPSESALICLTVLGVFSLIAGLVLVMGYKTVKIKGSVAQ